MICQKCGKENNKNAIYCKNCGANLPEDTSSPIDPQFVQVSQKTSSKLPYIVTVVVILAAVIITVIFFLKKPGEKELDRSDSQAIQQSSYEGAKTYVTLKSNYLSNIPIYGEPGDAIKIAKIPEAACCQFLESSDYQGEEWVKINYCDREGWLPMSQLRYVGEGASFFHVDEDVRKNIVFVNEREIKLHTEPKTSSSYAFTNVPYGTEFEVFELKKGWGKIEYAGTECWVDMKVVSSYATLYWQIERCDGKYTGINMREDANESSEVLTDISLGTVMQAEDFQNGWGKFTYAGHTGWVKLHYATSCGSEGLSYSEDF